MHSMCMNAMQGSIGYQKVVKTKMLQKNVQTVILTVALGKAVWALPFFRCCKDCNCCRTSIVEKENVPDQ